MIIPILFSISWSIISKETQTLIGTIQLRLSEDKRSGHISYWIGVEFWNRGYATEAATMVLQYAFEHLNLEIIYAEYYQRNPASGAVLKKLGFSFVKTEIKIEKLNNRLEHFDLYVLQRNQFIKNPS